MPLLGYKYATRDVLEASGLEYTYIVNGFFMETQVGLFRSDQIRFQIRSFGSVPPWHVCIQVHCLMPYVVAALWLQLTPVFSIDVPNGKATIKGNPDATFTITSYKDIARWTAAALLDPKSK